MTMSWADLERLSAELGIPMLPADHPEYSTGPQTYFVSSTSPMLKQKRLASQDGGGPTEQDSGGESLEASIEGDDDSDPSADDDELDDEPGGEHCPVCGQVNYWGKVDVCRHNIAVVFDGHDVSSESLGSVISSWQTCLLLPPLDVETVNLTGDPVVAFVRLAFDLDSDRVARWVPARVASAAVVFHPGQKGIPAVLDGSTGKTTAPLSNLAPL